MDSLTGIADAFRLASNNYNQRALARTQTTLASYQASLAQAHEAISLCEAEIAGLRAVIARFKEESPNAPMLKLCTPAKKDKFGKPLTVLNDFYLSVAKSCAAKAGVPSAAIKNFFP